MNVPLPALLSCLLAATLSSCGGGGGGGGTPPPPANAAPSLQTPAALAGTSPLYSFVLPTASSQSLQFAATDPDGDQLQWLVSVDGAATAAGIHYSSPVVGGTFVLTIDGVTAPVASRVTLLVEDPRGAATAIDVLVVRSGAPSITGITPSTAFAGRPLQVEVTGTALRLGGAVTTNVRFDGVLGTGVLAPSDTVIRCTTPTAAIAGPTVVAVDHLYGMSALPSSSFTLFEYPPSFAATDQRLDATVAAAPDLALDGTAAHAVWLETGVVHHRRSIDGGANWLPAQSISGAEVASEPQVLVFGTEVLVAWIGDGQTVRMARSVDGGLLFLPAQRIDGAGASTVVQSRPRFCQTGDRRYATWIAGDAAQGLARLVACASTDRGATWNGPVAVDDGIANQGVQSITANGATAWIVCLDERAGPGARGVYVTRSSNGGTSWSAVRRLSQPGVVATEPCLTSLGNRVHVAFVNAGSLFYNGSIDSGATWASAPTLVRDVSAGVVEAPQICCAVDRVLVGYLQAGTTVWASRFSGNGTAASHTQIDNDADVDSQPKLTCVGIYVFAAWRRGNVGDGSARLRQAASTDGGATFSAASGVGNGAAAQDHPQIVHDGARLLLGWLDSRDPAVGLFVNRTAQ